MKQNRQRLIRKALKSVKKNTKNYKTMRKFLFIFCLLLGTICCSCSTTKASVKGLAEGTTTTITITTNNPVTTNTNPQVEWGKKN